MAISAGDLTKLRRMIADPAPGEFLDAELSAMAEKYPLDTSTGSVYDLNAIAAEVWGLKAAMAAGSEERFTSDGKSFDFGAVQDKAFKMQKHYAQLASDAYSPYGAGVMTREDISDDAKLEPLT